MGTPMPTRHNVSAHLTRWKFYHLRLNCTCIAYSFSNTVKIHFLDSSKQKDKNGMWQMFLGQFPKTDDAFLQRFKLWATKETLLNNSNVGEEQMVKERKWKEREKKPPKPPFLPTVTAATTGDTITDRVTPPAITKFLLCLEMSLPS